MSLQKAVATSWERARIELRQLGLYLHNVPADGWCQYAALGLITKFGREGVHTQVMSELSKQVRETKTTPKLTDTTTWGDEVTLEVYCNKTSRSIRIYGMGLDGNVTSYLFPIGSALPELTFEGKKCALWLNGSHYQAVLPNPPEAPSIASNTFMKYLSMYQTSATNNDAFEALKATYLHLVTTYPEAANLPCCCLCLLPMAKTTNLADSHRIPDSFLSMIDLKWAQDNLVKNTANTEHFKLFCHAGKKPPPGTLMCEELLSRVEEETSKLLAGDNWKKKDGPSKLDADGWLCKVQNLDPDAFYCGQYGPELPQCLASIFFRILITSSIPEDADTKKHNSEKASMLAQLHNYIFYPNTQLSLTILLSWSWDGMSTTDRPNYEPELIRHVIVTPAYGEHIIVHFAILGWHFLLLDAAIEKPFWGGESSIVKINPCGGSFKIGFADRILKDPNWNRLTQGYLRNIHMPSINSSSISVASSIYSKPYSGGLVARLPTGWKLGSNKLQLPKGYQEIKDIQLLIGQSATCHLFLVNHSYTKVSTMVVHIVQGEKDVTCAYNENGKPAYNTSHDRFGTPFNDEDFIGMLWKYLKE